MDLTEVEEDSRQPLLGSSSSSGVYSSLNTYLYTGHFLARWGARMWEFAVGLYMINVWPNSLLFAAVYGVVEATSVALLGPTVGRCIDRFTYIQVLRAWLLTQNISFAVAGISVFLLLFYHSLKSTNFSAFIFLFILTNLTGATAVLSSMAGTIMIEREWVVVISSGKPQDVLTKMNSTIRRIDLICKLMAPVFTGLIVSFISLKASAIALALWNTISVWLQYWLLLSVYNGYPALSENSQRTWELASNDTCESSLIPQEKDLLSSETISLSSENGYVRKVICLITKCFSMDAWIVYLKQEVVLPGVALALLYFTVLSFGTLMTATLEWKKIPAYVIGIARGVSAVVGISATFLYPVLHSHISTLRTGLWSIWTQWCFLVVCVASIWVQNDHISAWMLMSGVAASRLGLWMFDLAVMQLMQDLVPESDRCVVGGVQNSLQSMLDLMNYIMGIIISNPQEFGKLVIISFSWATLAGILYTIHIYRVRKHLFHFDKLFAKTIASTNAA
ncbi:solute carrier family 40 member 1-like [Aristolochia californica]|uniref:solute carrier family 40 member 1-like n=1 Tax=Aristolochia californica TaxID=171875 RepID=UPI0035E3620E